MYKSALIFFSGFKCEICIFLDLKEIRIVHSIWCQIRYFKSYKTKILNTTSKIRYVLMEISLKKTQTFSYPIIFISIQKVLTML